MVKQCPECDADDFMPHCNSSTCMWLICKVCHVRWDYVLGTYFAPASKG